MLPEFRFTKPPCAAMWLAHILKEQKDLLLYAQALFNFLLEELLDDVLGGGIKALVLPLGLLVDNAALHLLLLHLLLLALGAFERCVAGHHLVDTAAQGPPVH